MAESKTAKKIVKLTNTVDKLIADMYKNWKKVSEALKELKEDAEKEK